MDVATLDFSILAPIGFVSMGAMLVLLGEVWLSRGDSPVTPWLVLICTLALASSPLWAPLIPVAAPNMMTLLLTVMGLGLLAIFIEQMARARIEDALRRVACTIFAVAYLGIGGAVLLFRVIRTFESQVAGPSASGNVRT